MDFLIVASFLLVLACFGQRHHRYCVEAGQKLVELILQDRRHRSDDTK